MDAIGASDGGGIRTVANQEHPPRPIPLVYEHHFFTLPDNLTTNQTSNKIMIKRNNTANGNRLPIAKTPPKHLNQTAAAIWKETLKTITASGYQIDQLDNEAFTAFCSAAATVRQCDELIERDGLCVDGGRDGIKRHPAASAKNAALTQLRAYANALGLTPASRAKLPAEHQPEDYNEFLDD